MLSRLFARLRHHRYENILLVLILCSAFGCGLAGFRIYKTTYLIFIGLLWNLFLAWIPYLLSLSVKLPQRVPGWWVLVLPLWLLFFPNAPYLVTDLVHLKPRPHNIPLWYDLVMLSTFAWLGLLLGFLSLSDMHDVVKEKTGRRTGWLFATLVLVLSSYGIYLGRFGRWNSWDVVVQPGALMAEIADHWTATDWSILSMMVVYSSFMGFMYLIIRTLIKR